MSLALHTISRDESRSRKKKRLGRGNGSGKGNYSGKGMKGQRSRSGGKKGLQLKGMKARLMSMPKHRGNKSVKAPIPVFNVSQLNRIFKDGATVSIATLKLHDVIPNGILSVKILGDGAIEKKLHFKGQFLFSAKAKEKLTQAGCTFEVK